MKRRTFIYTSIALGSLKLPILANTKPQIEKWSLFYQTQNILFPKHKNAPSASEFGATLYLKNITKHPSFNNNDIIFLNEGADELLKREKNFLNQNEEQQNRSLQKFAQTTFGENWISLLLFYTIEALVSDPIYGGNKNEIGWKWLQHNTGLPRPKVRYAQL